jgi:hypothetical protein
MIGEATQAQHIERLPLQSDRRADGGSREVSVSSKGVSIARRLSGVSMLIRLPVSSYRGVALDVESIHSGGVAYRLALAHSDPDFDVLLTETKDPASAAAEWKYWSSFLELPRLAAKDGEFAPLETTLGGVIVRETVERRGASAVARRRPRFLARRKSGDPARSATSHAGEREIICYE